jgi:hypothetical protein
MKVFSGGIHVITISALRVVGTEALLLRVKFIVTSGSWLMVNVLYIFDVCAITLIATDILVIRSHRRGSLF